MSGAVALLLFEGHMHGRWVTLGQQFAGQPPGTISDHPDGQDGAREVYVTQCFADHATIKRLRGGLDLEVGGYRVVNTAELEAAELVKRLEIGESHEMRLKPSLVNSGVIAPHRKLVRYRCVKMP